MMKGPPGRQIAFAVVELPIKAAIIYVEKYSLLMGYLSQLPVLIDRAYGPTSLRFRSSLQVGMPQHY
jgi:hypothetical protein